MVNLTLDISNTVLESHDCYFEYFLASVRDNSKMLVVIQVDSPLIEEGSSIYN